MDDLTGEIVEALRARRIHSMRSVSDPGWRRVTVGMSVDELERFLDTIIKRPISEDDRLAVRIFGRPHDLTASETAWRFDLVPGLPESDLIRMHAYVNIPREDVSDLIRLRAFDPRD